MHANEKLNYVEFPAIDLNKTKQFFQQAFNWKFVDYGEEYTAFSGEGLDGGFFKAPLSADTRNGSALLVFYSNNLAATQQKIEAAGGDIVKPIFSFPGGRRFHFKEPCGNEFAVWSDL